MCSPEIVFMASCRPQRTVGRRNRRTARVRGVRMAGVVECGIDTRGFPRNLGDLRVSREELTGNMVFRVDGDQACIGKGEPEAGANQRRPQRVCTVEATRPADGHGEVGAP